MAGNGNGKRRVRTYRLELLAGILLAAVLWFWLVGTGVSGRVRAGSPDLSWISYQPWLIAIPVLLGAALIVIGAKLKWRWLRRTLATRRRLAWVPAAPAADGSGGCDPSDLQLDGFLRQLAGIPQPVAHWQDREATAVRFEIESVGHGRVLQVLEAPERMLSGVQTAASRIGGAELIPPEQLGLPERPEPRELTKAPGGREEVDV